jgi:hypothetical protein
MNVSNISVTSDYYQNNVQNPWQQNRQDFNSLGSALQSGDLTSAQNAFAAWQKDLQSVPGSTSPQTAQTAQASGPFGNNSKANSDLQALGTALQSGDVAGAQKAFASLKQDLHGVRHAHHRQAAAPAQNDGDADDSGQSPATALSATLPPISSSGILNTQA